MRSEHCVGFLKGRWSSLRGLRVAISNEKLLHFATLWIIGCIHLHAFAMKHEEGQDMRRDTFYREGHKYQKKQRKAEEKWRRRQRRRQAENEEELDRNDDIELLEGKLKREELKDAIIAYFGMDEN